MCMGLTRKLWMAPLSRGIFSGVGVRAYSSVFHHPEQILSAKPVHLPMAHTLTPTAKSSSALHPIKYISRNYSVLSRPSFMPHSLGTLGLRTRIEARQFHWSGLVRYDRLQNLEDAANRDRDNANAQAVFMQVPIPSGKALILRKALLDKYPDYVVKRYESGGVATNAECDAIYRQALEKIGDSPRSMSSSSRFRDTPLPPPLPRTQPRLDLPRYPSPQETARQPFTGMKGNPVHVVVDEGWQFPYCT
jgi:hypothetical protein